MLLALLVLTAGCQRPVSRTSPLDQTGVQWAPVDWRIENPSVEGNPFDLVARVTFTHLPSGEARTTEMFYVGEGTWSFRFTGTAPGTWTFASTSGDPDLDGLQGAVEIEPNAEAYGFVTHVGNRWARQRGVGGELEAFVPQFVMYEPPDYLYRHRGALDRDITVFLDEHGFTGFHVPVFCRWFDLDTERCGDLATDDPNPDLRTFEVLETLIWKTHAAGGVVHLWAWGDESRTQTPTRWGLNGVADRRLQRYIAARLGSLPGWTMGYGFDLWEWVEGPELTAWHAYVHDHLGWPHMLGARSSKNELTQLSEDLDYASYEQHRPAYAMYVQTIEARPSKPAFSEDRFRIRDSEQHRAKDYDMERTRRGLWHAAMAGGVANIWGHLLGQEDGRSGSTPYPRPAWIKTYASFINPRFALDLVRDNDLAEGAYVLRSEDRQRYLLYGEAIDRITLDLTSSPAPLRAVAVDATQPYEEIDLGVLSPDRQVLQLARPSDWAIAIGDFE